MIDDEDLGAALQSLASAVRSISHGGVDGPLGLEALSMDLVGPGSPGHDSLAQAIRDAGGEINLGLHAIADAIGGHHPWSRRVQTRGSAPL